MTGAIAHFELRNSFFPWVYNATQWNFTFYFLVGQSSTSSEKWSVYRCITLRTPKRTWGAKVLRLFVGQRVILLLLQSKIPPPWGVIVTLVEINLIWIAYLIWFGRLRLFFFFHNCILPSCNHHLGQKVFQPVTTIWSLSQVNHTVSNVDYG